MKRCRAAIWVSRKATTILYSMALGMVPILTLSGAASAVDPVRDGQWHLDYLNVEQAQRYSQGDGVTVGVVDTGVDAGHPDLVGSILSGYAVPPLTQDPQKDLYGHGTAMAGLIAAHGRSVGIAPKAKILPVVHSQTGSGPGFGGGVRWAVDHGASVLCLAYGAPDDPLERSDVEYAIGKDVVVIAAIGNTNESFGPYPAAYPGVVGAVGVDRNGNHSSTSVVASNATLAAPSDDIVSTAPRSSASSTGYVIGTGTSNSTAIIAGAAALVRSKFPTMSAAEVIHRLTATADDKGPPGRDDQYGYGIVNIVKALTVDVPPLTPSATPANGPTQALPQPGGSSKAPLVIGGLVLVAVLAAAAVAVGVTTRRRPP